jgi:tetratricopeptide (TPR) repeat protein
MNPPSTNWLPGIIAFGAALVTAITFLLMSVRKHAPVAKPSSAEDLETRYQAMIHQLKEHAANKHIHTAEAWAAEQAQLEQAAAAVLRERAGVKHEALKAEARAAKKVARAEATGVLAKNPLLKGALWGVGVVGFFVLLGVVLSQESTTRVDGQEMTGMVPGGAKGPMEPAPPQEDVELKAAMDRANRSPDDIDALSNAAKELISRQMFEDAAPLIRRATALDPYHVQTRTHRAVMLAVEGQTMTALDELQHVADTFEDAHEARLFAGMLALQAEDRERALVQLERYVAEAPIEEQPPMLRKGIAQLRQDVAQQNAPMPRP